MTYVVLVIGGNDCDFDWAAVARAPSVKHIPKTSLDAFEKMLVGLHRKNQKKRRDARVVHDAAHQSAEIFFKRHLHGRRRLQGDGVFERRPYDISRYHECYNLAIVKCALENNCRLIDRRTPLLLDRKYMDLLCPDGIHPNEQGHMLMAKVVENIIDGMLKRSASGK